MGILMKKRTFLHLVRRTCALTALVGVSLLQTHLAHAQWQAPAIVDFGALSLGDMSTRAVTLTNISSAVVYPQFVSSLTRYFEINTELSTCQHMAGLEAGSSCVLVFNAQAPLGVGPHTASLTINAKKTSSTGSSTLFTHTITLQAELLAPSNPTLVLYPSVAGGERISCSTTYINTSAYCNSVELWAFGGDVVIGELPTQDGIYHFEYVPGGARDCAQGTVIPAGDYCRFRFQLGVDHAPGIHTFELTVPSSANSVTIPYQAERWGFALSPRVLDFGEVSIGDKATRIVTVTNLSNNSIYPHYSSTINSNLRVNTQASTCRSNTYVPVNGSCSLVFELDALTEGTLPDQFTLQAKSSSSSSSTTYFEAYVGLQGAVRPADEPTLLADKQLIACGNGYVNKLATCNGPNLWAIGGDIVLGELPTELGAYTLQYYTDNKRCKSGLRLEQGESCHLYFNATVWHEPGAHAFDLTVPSSANPVTITFTTEREGFKVAPRVVDFGEVAVGEKASKMVVITNSSSRTIYPHYSTSVSTNLRVDSAATTCKSSSPLTRNSSCSIVFELNALTEEVLDAQFTVEAKSGSSSSESTYFEAVIDLKAQIGAEEARLVAESHQVTCSTGYVDGASTCSGPRLWAAGGDVVLGDFPTKDGIFSFDYPDGPYCQPGQTLANGEYCNLRFSLSVEHEPGTHTVDLTIPSSANAETISYTVLRRGFRLTPRVVDFGEVPAGEKVSRYVSVRNEHTSSVYPRFAPSVGSGFTVNTNASTCKSNTALSPNSTCTLVVEFNGLTSGEVAAELSIEGRSDSISTSTKYFQGVIDLKAVVQAPEAPKLLADAYHVTCTSGYVDNPTNCVGPQLLARGGAVVLGELPAQDGIYGFDYKPGETYCQSGQTLEDGESCTLSFSLTVQGEPGVHTIGLTVPSSANPVTISYLTNQSGFRFTPQVVDFGTLQLGETVSRYVTVRNVSTSSVYLHITSPSNFKVNTDASTCQSSKVLGANSSCGIVIEFVALAEGESEAELLVEGRSSSSPTSSLRHQGVISLKALVPPTGAPSLVADASHITCSTGYVNATINCQGPQLWAAGGDVVLGELPSHTDIYDLTYTTGQPYCESGQTLNNGDSCTLRFSLLVNHEPGLNTFDLTVPSSANAVTISYQANVQGFKLLPRVVHFNAPGEGETVVRTVSVRNLSSSYVYPHFSSSVDGNFVVNTTASTCSSSTRLSANSTCNLVFELTGPIEQALAAQFVIEGKTSSSPTSTTLFQGMVELNAAEPSLEQPMLVASDERVACGGYVGRTFNCNELFLSAAGGEVVLGEFPTQVGAYTLTYQTGAYCAPGQTLSDGERCRLGFTVAPDEAGVHSFDLVVPSSTNPVTISYVLNAQGFALAPAEVNFGELALGETVTRTVTVTNASNLTVYPRFTSAFGPNMRYNSTASTCRSGAALAPSGACTIVFELDALTTGELSGTLTIDAKQTSDSTSTTLFRSVVEVTANVSAPGELMLLPTAEQIQCGAGYVNSAAICSGPYLWAVNGDVTLGELPTQVGPYDIEYYVGSTYCASGRVIKQGERCYLYFKVTVPHDVGTHTFDLTVPSNADPVTVSYSTQRQGFEFSTRTVDFGTPSLGETISRTVTVTNASNERIYLLFSYSFKPNLRFNATASTCLNLGALDAYSSCTLVFEYDAFGDEKMSASFRIDAKVSSSSSAETRFQGFLDLIASVVLPGEPVLIASTHQVACSNGYVSRATSCINPYLWAMGGDIVLGELPTQVSPYAISYYTGGDRCTSGLLIKQGESCRLYFDVIVPHDPGTHSFDLTVPSSANSVTITYSTHRQGFKVSPRVVDFGDLAVGDSATAMVTVTNMYQNTVYPYFSTSISQNLRVNASTSSCKSLTGLGPNASCTLVFEFEAFIDGEHEHSLTLEGKSSSSASSSTLFKEEIELITRVASYEEPTLVPSVDRVTCSTGYVNNTANCSALLLWATAGDVILGELPTQVGSYTISYYTGSNRCQTGLVVEQGEYCQLYFSVRVPHEPGVHTFDLTVPSSANSVTISYTTERYGFEFTPRVVDFGELSLGEKQTRIVTVKNTYTQTITPYFAYDFGPNLRLDTAASSCRNGASISPNGSCSLVFEFDAVTDGALDTLFTIEGREGSTTRFEGVIELKAQVSAPEGPALVASADYGTCGSGFVNSPVTCDGPYLWSAKGDIVLGGLPTSIGGYAIEYLAGTNRCAPGLVLEQGDYCYLSFRITIPHGPGTYPFELTIPSDANTVTIGYSVDVRGFRLTPRTVDYGVLAIDEMLGQKVYRAVNVVNDSNSTVYLDFPTIIAQDLRVNTSASSCKYNAQFNAGASCTLILEYTVSAPGALDTSFVIGGRTGSSTSSSMRFSEAVQVHAIIDDVGEPTLIAKVTDSQCSAVPVGTDAACGVVRLLAGGDDIVFGSFPTGNGIYQFDWMTSSPNNCRPGMTLARGTYCDLALRRTASEIGEHTTPITITTVNANAVTITYTGTVYGFTASQTLIDFGTVPLGESVTQSVTVANHSSMTLYVKSPAFTGETQDFVIESSNCTENRRLDSNASCTITFRFTPQQEGLLEAGFVVQGAKTASSAPIFAKEILMTGFGGEVGEVSWRTSEFGMCVGGTGDWVLGPWGPEFGCGEVEQTRTAGCVVAPDSGERTRTVECISQDGTVLPDSFCDPETRPVERESCTPTGVEACGVNTEDLVRSIFLDNACSNGENRCGGAEGTYCLLLPL